MHQCYASNGPIKPRSSSKSFTLSGLRLAATLIGGSGDCLKQVGEGTLKAVGFRWQPVPRR